jgi:hypothetical protein
MLNILAATGSLRPVLLSSKKLADKPPVLPVFLPNKTLAGKPPVAPVSTCGGHRFPL